MLDVSKYHIILLKKVNIEHEIEFFLCNNTQILPLLNVSLLFASFQRVVQVYTRFNFLILRNLY